MTAKTDTISEATAWVHTVWKKAESNWTGRIGQDREYRTHVIHPALHTVLRNAIPKAGMRILDIGCGDGALLESKDIRKLIGEDGWYHGIDLSDELLDTARASYDAPNITFRQGDITDPGLHDKTGAENVDAYAVISDFVIQEVPNLEMYMDNLARLTPPGALAVTVTVHPDFADWLRAEGRLRTEPGLGGGDTIEGFQWRWAGYYPIVDEVNGAFHLPHFQRTVGDYTVALEQHGFSVEQIIDLPEPTSDLPRLVRGGVPPFTPFAENHYWPRIGEAPSAVIFVARKEANRAIKG